MRVRKRKGAEELLAENPQIVVANPEELKGKWQQRFAKKQPIHIEIGMGKGQFITGMAKAHPDINYIGIDMQVSVVSFALDKDQIYLNFSDPWPKTRHEKRRLTSKDFLAVDEQILRNEGEIHFKTDNRGLFEYSLASFSQYGMIIKQVWLDLHASAEATNNVMTEYEEKFSAKGQPIYRVEAVFPKK